MWWLTGRFFMGWGGGKPRPCFASIAHRRVVGSVERVPSAVLVVLKLRKYIGNHSVTLGECRKALTTSLYADLDGLAAIARRNPPNNEYYNHGNEKLPTMHEDCDGVAPMTPNVPYAILLDVYDDDQASILAWDVTLVLTESLECFVGVNYDQSHTNSAACTSGNWRG